MDHSTHPQLRQLSPSPASSKAAGFSISIKEIFLLPERQKCHTQAANKICAVYGESAVTERTVRKWFARFKAADINLKDQERPGRSFTTNEDQIKTLIENNPRCTTRKLAEMLNMSKSTIHEHFVKLGYINRFDVWVPHDLTEKNLMNCIFICDSLYKRNEKTPFLKQ